MQSDHSKIGNISLLKEAYEALLIAHASIRTCQVRNLCASVALSTHFAIGNAVIKASRFPPEMCSHLRRGVGGDSGIEVWWIKERGIREMFWPEEDETVSRRTQQKHDFMDVSACWQSRLHAWRPPGTSRDTGQKCPSLTTCGISPICWAKHWATIRLSAYKRLALYTFLALV